MTYQDCNTKKARIALLKEKLGTNAQWAVKGCVRIYEYQTAEEQNIGGTVEDNGVGFTGADGDILSSFAEQINKGRTLSDKQMAILFKKMPKYARQLDGVAQRKAERQVELPNMSRSQAIANGAVTYTGD